MLELVREWPHALPLGVARWIAKDIVESCKTCQLVNAYHAKLPEGKRLRGDRHGQFWEVDFTEVRPAKYGLKYLLIFVDTFQGGCRHSPQSLKQPKLWPRRS